MVTHAASEPLFAAIALHVEDNVATALRPLAPGQTAKISGPRGLFETSVTDAVPFGHKFALTDLPEGTLVIKYGSVIGRARHLIPAGGMVHVHNVESLRGRGDLAEGGAGNG